MARPLLELDAGERDDETEELWSCFDGLNVACGGHVAIGGVTFRVLDFCARPGGPKLGAHPSYPDRENFGRLPVAMLADQLADTVREQCRGLAMLARDRGLIVGWVKPHGALYHDARAREDIARAVVRGAIAGLGPSVRVIGPRTGGALQVAAIAEGLEYLREGFADRGMRSDGTLVPRNQAGALITEPAAAAAQARALASEVDAMCIHGDTPGALAIAHAVREALDG